MEIFNYFRKLFRYPLLVNQDQNQNQNQDQSQEQITNTKESHHLAEDSSNLNHFYGIQNHQYNPYNLQTSLGYAPYP